MTLEAGFVLVLLVAALVFLAREWLPPDVVAVSLVILLVAGGILSPAEAFSSFANEFIFVLCAIFILSGALARTGIMERFSEAVHRVAGRSQSLATALFMLVAAVSSAFISNTSTTAVLLPAVLQHAREIGVGPGRLLMPLAFASMLGGSSTLIGTSANLAANGFLVKSGIRPISLFEFVPIGIAVTVLGILYMVVAGRRFLAGEVPTSLGREYRIHEYVSEIVVQEESSLAGELLAETPLARKGIQVLTIHRGERHLRPGPLSRLRAGDVLVVKAPRRALLEIADAPDVALGDTSVWSDTELTGDEMELAEAMVLPHSALAGNTLRQLRFRERYGITVLAVYRRGHSYPAGVRDLVLRVGDVLLIHGTREQFDVLLSTEAVRILGEVRHLPFRTRKGWLALGALVAAIAAGAAGWLPLSIALLLAVVVIVLAGVIPAGELYELVEWPLVVMIGGMTCLGLALQTTGASTGIATGLTTLALPLGEVAVLAALAMVTMALTQPLSNAAAALVVLPVAVAVAAQTGQDPRLYALVVTLAASLSFITPLEPSCLLVFAPGKYRFLDFVKVGTPLTLITLVVLLVMAPRFLG